MNSRVRDDDALVARAGGDDAGASSSMSVTDSMNDASFRPGPAHPSFWEAFKYWLKLGFISFGGPVGHGHHAPRAGGAGPDLEIPD